MKLVKSLLLGSVAGVAAVASAQAADLPFRKAAPVEYVRVCDFTGAGYFYIPGTDSCLKIEGYLRFEYAAINQSNAYFPTAPSIPNSGGQQASQLNGFGGTFFAPGAGGFLPGRNRDLSGFKADGRIAADVRTQTAYGTLRTYVRFDIIRNQGNYAIGSSANTFANYENQAATSANLDKGYIQFAGITAGRVQSFFDFYADNYNFEGIANSDQSTNVLAYTYTFGGGFSATIAAEDRTTRTGAGIGNIGALGVGAGAAVLGAAYAGQTIPDIVAEARVDQAWGAAQISAAYHDVNTSANAPIANQFVSAQSDGFAVQAGVQIKLPMLAAGDDLWLEGAYQEGAFLYQDSSTGLNNGFNNLAVGGFQHVDHDAVAIANVAGNGYTLQKGTGFSVMAAFHHYFTPQFHDVLFGSYEEIGYGNTVRNTSFLLGGLGDASEYRIGNQFIFTPVHNLDIGLEFLYAHIDQDIAGTAAGVANQAATVAALNGIRALGVTQNPNAFEGRLRVERDF